MCGIAGIISVENRGYLSGPEHMGRMLAMIRHRGPDQFGIYLDGAATLGCARLSIIDVGGGQQPRTGRNHPVMVARVPEAVVIVSNRGPVSFSYADDGSLEAHRGAGGVVSSLGPLVRDTGASWMAAAMSDADREAAAAGTIETEGFRFRSRLSWLPTSTRPFRMCLSR